MDMGPTTMPYTEDMSYEGKTYSVTVEQLPVIRCPDCEEFSVGPEGFAAMDRALRSKVRLLEPTLITKYRERLNLRKKEFAERIRVTAETQGRVENGHRHQSALFDWAVRMYAACAEVRELSDRFLAGDDLLAEMEASTRSAEFERAYHSGAMMGTTVTYMAPEMRGAQQLIRESWDNNLQIVYGEAA
jgi:transcriptional regulator with XRE-family HTH domain